MKYLIVLLSVLLTACGGSGGGENTGGKGPKDSAPDGCKSLYSVWRSPVDNEELDLRGFENAATQADYAFVAGNGEVCGYVSNPNHDMEATISAALPSANEDFNIHYVATLAIGDGTYAPGTCRQYFTGSGSFGKYAQMDIYTAGKCNEIEVCDTQGSCKRME